MAELIETKIRRFSAGTILKVCLFVVLPSSTLGLLFGLFALVGFDTVRWGNGSVLGIDGLLLGVVLGLVGGMAFAVANFLLVWMGMTVVSRFKTTKIHYLGPDG